MNKFYLLLLPFLLLPGIGAGLRVCEEMGTGTGRWSKSPELLKARPEPVPISSQTLSGRGDSPAARKASVGLAVRTPWTTSRITGSPDPPHPYRIVRAFPKLTFKNPIVMQNLPGSNRLFVGEQGGKIFSFENKQSVAKADLFVDLAKELHSWDSQGKVKGFDSVYGLAFHPQFAKNRYCYICYVLASKTGEQLPDGSRVSRFRVLDTNPPRVDPGSEKILLTFLAGGHNGGCLQFGKDGYFYISTGDGADPNPPDRYNTGQDVSDLLSSMLRIDVDHEDNKRPYAIPADNPFTKLQGARPEIWAYGFRNPWRFSFDRLTGDLWVGDVGWELWEMVYRVRRGGNYGWSIMEGRQPVRPDSKRGPTPILPPTLDFPHAEAASITGGYVYRGQRLKDLRGAYICGDWMTYKVWGTRFDEQDHILWHQELAQGRDRIVAFGEDNEGELYYLKYDEAGSIHQLAPSDTPAVANPHFPTRLSETGLFSSTVRHEPAPGVLPFSINAEQWADHATAERFVALPNDSAVRAHEEPVPVGDNFFQRQLFFPRDGVLAKTISIEMERGKPETRRRLETQILHFDGAECRGYTYRWNEDQSDAVLVPSGGAEASLLIRDSKAPGGQRKQTWHFPSRAECLQCHNPWTGYALAFTLPQLNKSQHYGDTCADQLETLKHLGFLNPLQRVQDKDRPGWTKPIPRLACPSDAGAKAEARARAYLHVNCSHCHQLGAGGTADIELRFNIPLDQTKLVGVRPVQGNFDIPGAQLIAPSKPYHSVLFYRMAKLGRGRMPHIGSEIVDEQGLDLIRNWIEQLPGSIEEKLLVDKLCQLDEPAALAKERVDEATLVREAAERIAHTAGREFVTDEDRKKARDEFFSQAGERTKARGMARAEIIGRFLSTTSGALFMAQALGDGRIPASLHPDILAMVKTRPGSEIRDLFERFLPDDQRIKRLGSVIKPEQLLPIKGNADRGKELFKSAGLQCVNCHRIGGTGSTLGPDLSQLARKYTKSQILESILEPSKSIEPKYVNYVLETDAGQLHSGLLFKKDDKEVVLHAIGDKEIRVPIKSVQQLTPQKASIMPEQLLRDLTLEQAADLLEFLSSLK